MPWDCQQCGTTVERDDVHSCPECASDKAAWTLQADRTRTLVVTRRRLDCRRGVGHSPELEPEWVPAEGILISEAASLAALADVGEPPPPAHVLWVRLHPKDDEPPVVTVEVNYEYDEVDELEFEVTDPPGPEGWIDARFVFGWGAEPPMDSLSFEGVHVVDLSEEDMDGNPGYAPTVDLRTSSQPTAKTLPVGTCWLTLVAKNTAGEPLAGWRYAVDLEDGSAAEGALDAEGRLRLEDVHQDTCRVRLLPPGAEGGEDETDVGAEDDADDHPGEAEPERGEDDGCQAEDEEAYYDPEDPAYGHGKDEDEE